MGWNGLAIQAFAEAGQTFQRKDYIDAAERAASFILRKVRSEDGLLLHVTRGGVAKVPAYLEDYAGLVGGLLALHQSTEEERWLKELQERLQGKSCATSCSLKASRLPSQNAF